LIKLFENSNLDNIYSKPECHVLSNAFSMSNNTEAIVIFLLHLRVTGPLNSYIAVSWCDVNRNQIVLRCVEKACFFNMLLDYIMDDFFE
jgi:hypothetical protein